MQILAELQRYNSCAVWLESFRSKSTKNVYSIHLSLFCKFHNVTPDHLLKLSNSVGSENFCVLIFYLQFWIQYLLSLDSVFR